MTLPLTAPSDIRRSRQRAAIYLAKHKELRADAETIARKTDMAMMFLVDQVEAILDEELARDPFFPLHLGMAATVERMG